MQLTTAATYLAFRLGYATLAAGALGQDPDGRRFAAAADRYHELLQTELSYTSESAWNA
jgi:hypothetical protein